ncbi:MAG: carbohydrate ABC transporter permease [Lachnospiraceae bacterium]
MLNKNKIQVGSKAVDMVLNLIMLIIIFLVLYPFMNIIAISFSSPGAITRGEVSLLPVGFNTKGYEMIFGDIAIYRAYLNTILYAVVGTAINLLFTSMISYALMVNDFVLRKPITILLTITMFFSGGMVPSYILILNLKLMDTIWAIVLPSAISAYNIFIYRSFFKGISPEIREAAFVDGAGDCRILFQMYMPLSKALYATFGLFSIVGYWNMWFEPLLYLKSDLKQPVQMILRNILFTSGVGGMSGAQEMVSNQMLNPKNLQYACIIATIGPVLLVYPFLQKYFEKGMMVGAVKG